MAQERGPLASAAEAAARLGVTDNTIRNWAKGLGPMLQSEVGLDGIRRFDLAQVERVAALRRRRLPYGAIRELLAAEPVDEAEPREPFEDALLARMDRLIDAVERIAAYFEGNEPPER